MAENEETQDEQANDPEALGFIADVTTENAQRALRAADDVGMQQWRVRVVRDGFEAPNAIVQRYAELLEEDTKAAKASDKEAKAQAKADAKAAKDAEKAAKAAGAGTQVPDAGAVDTGLTGAPVEGALTGEAHLAGTGTVGEAPASDDLPADNDDWTHARLDAYVSDNGLEVAKTLSKPDKVAAILAALNEKE